MGTDQPVSNRKTNRRRWLLRGESAIASAGIALAMILLGAMAASAWWTMRSERDVLEDTRIEQVRAIGTVLSQSAEVMLAQNELSTLRRLVAEAGSEYNLTQCKIVLSDGQVIASSDPNQITVQKLPAQWTRARTLDDALKQTEKGAFSVAYPINVEGRGAADLEITAAVTRPFRTNWGVQTGVGAIGAVAMLAFLVVYRHMRLKLRALGAIQEALLAMGSGETAASVLAVSTELGIEAKAWNEVIAAREKLRNQDVAERAREALGTRAESRGDLSAACDAMSQGLVLVDERNVITYANGAAAVFLQGKREELVGTDVSKHLEVDNVLQAIKDVAQGSMRRRTVMDVERRDEGGTGVLRFSIRPVRREDSASAMVIIEDITQQKVAEEARNAFVAHTTHELRTPLTNIRLYVETAIDEGEQNPTTRAKCLNVINGETRRLERIVGEMLSMAEIEAGSFKVKLDDVRLEALFEELKADYQQQATERQIQLTFNLPPKFPILKGDRDKIMLALHNLVGNALKYTMQGGRVSVNVDSNPKQLTVAISDTGIGISAEDAEKIFERFYRAKDPRVAKITGTGLGLTLAREVVRLHGGDIAVESQLNQGSTFTMALPLTGEAA